MAHPAGERLHCEQCDSEILYVKGCDCPTSDSKKHAMVCCGQEMTLVEGSRPKQAGQAPAHH